MNHVTRLTASNAAALFIFSMPLSISGFSLKYMVPKIPVTVAHRMVNTQSQTNRIEVARYWKRTVLTMYTIAVNADIVPTATAKAYS